MPTYLPETYGGAEQQSRKLAATLLDRNLSVTVLTPCVEGATQLSGREGLLTIKRFRQPQLPNLGGRHMLSFLLWTVKSAYWLWRNRSKYDLVHIIHGRLHAVGPLLGAAISRKPSLIKIGRGGDHFDLAVVRRKRLIGSACAILIKHLTTGFVANSQEIADDFSNWNVDPSRVHRIPNGVVMPAPNDHLPTSNTPEIRFVYLGRLDTEKALDRMISGFAQVSHDHPARLIIVGDGPCASELAALAERLGVAHLVEFPGRVENVTPFLQMADFYISTSLSEGMSNALLEAMSYAVPPLVSRVSGVEDMVGDGVSGLLFEAGNDEDYVAQLRNALSLPSDARRRMGTAAARTMQQRFSMEYVAEKHIELYARFLRAPHQTRAG
ncbi:MAG: glycosyltransferase family 4 protein [Parvibaculum sp.]|nr:glycosyltransferase family 4 protein [Parvibaculum sp.]